LVQNNPYGVSLPRSNGIEVRLREGLVAESASVKPRAIHAVDVIDLAIGIEDVFLGYRISLRVHGGQRPNQ